MITHYPYKKLGSANHGWLKSNHHFSFSNYYNPRRMGFGALRVINDDIIKPGSGFGAHPHSNMEIITYIRSGEITHQDSEGNKGVVKAGEIQVMSAGSGIVHSEYNHSHVPLTLYQIWIETSIPEIKPRWESKKFPTKAVDNKLFLLVSGFPDDRKHAAFINQGVRIFGGHLLKGTDIEHVITNQAYILASNGEFEIKSMTPKHSIVMAKGDGAEVVKSGVITLTALSDCEIVLIDVPKNF
ncbi:pirin family protein [Colwellia psychrerythraea]|uniref:Pirin domain protein n=1 Tax=Colwellia psychrerythraea TaxID=28229 RepID=A0A099L3X8_COLPS|nr:pirin-like bicupin family protein [Colwellia psychrerythraea]KGJ97566.1 Pirin domain protein [Colwellia psychrerythraea]